MYITSRQLLFFSLVLSVLPSSTMRVSALSVAMLPLAAKAINILQSNDDGWAEVGISACNTALKHLHRAGPPLKTWTDYVIT